MKSSHFDKEYVSIYVLLLLQYNVYLHDNSADCGYGALAVSLSACVSVVPLSSLCHAAAIQKYWKVCHTINSRNTPLDTPRSCIKMSDEEDSSASGSGSEEGGSQWCHRDGLKCRFIVILAEEEDSGSEDERLKEDKTGYVTELSNYILDRVWPLSPSTTESAKRTCRRTWPLSWTSLNILITQGGTAET